MARILIVDDEQFVRDSIARILERAGHTVALADGCDAGLDACRKACPDLVITDIIMPGQDGVEFIRRLRAEGCGAPIVAISGGGNLAPEGYQPGAITTTAYLAAATKAGASVTLSKPFERKELLDAVRSALAG